MPVRIANILQELHLLPKKLIETPSASLVTSWYAGGIVNVLPLRYEESFMSLIDFESKDLNPKECENFLVFLDKALSKHSTVVETMAAVGFIQCLS